MEEGEDDVWQFRPYRWINPDGSLPRDARTFRPRDETDDLRDIVLEDLSTLGRDSRSGKRKKKPRGGWDSQILSPLTRVDCIVLKAEMD